MIPEHSLFSIVSHTHTQTHTDSHSYVFFQCSELLIKSDGVCPQWECPSSLVLSIVWEITGTGGFCNQFLRGVDDFQDLCRYVAERDSRVLLFCYKSRENSIKLAQRGIMQHGLA